MLITWVDVYLKPSTQLICLTSWNSSWGQSFKQRHWTDGQLCNAGGALQVWGSRYNSNISLNYPLLLQLDC